MKALILGCESDIAKGLQPLLISDGWEVEGWSRTKHPQLWSWNLLVFALGKVSPVGNWNKLNNYAESENIDSNLILPWKLLKEVWRYREPFASVCFLAGSNPQKIMKGYTPYNVAKMALLKLVEQLDFETSEAKFFAIGPGYIDTKIHKATLEANWPNERIARGNPNTVEQVYDCLTWCLSQPKEVVGGRNICVSDPYGPELAERLKANSNLYKLRRVE